MDMVRKEKKRKGGSNIVFWFIWGVFALLASFYFASDATISKAALAQKISVESDFSELEKLTRESREREDRAVSELNLANEKLKEYEGLESGREQLLELVEAYLNDKNQLQEFQQYAIMKVRNG